MRSKQLVPGASVLALALALASCGEGGSEAAGTADEPRTVEVTALDDPSYDPDSIEVQAGETVRFVVTNAGDADHEFVIGDLEMQQMAEEEAMGGMHGHVEAMATLALDPGQTAETTVTFDEPGELIYACHVGDHYEAGMIGSITIA